MAILKELFGRRIDLFDLGHLDTLAAPGRAESEAPSPDSSGTLEARRLLEHGFSGTITDTAGRKRQYEDGKPVAMHHDAPGAGARTSDIPPEEAAAPAPLWKRIPARAKAGYLAAKAKVRETLGQTAGGRAVLAMGDAGAWVYHQLERRALYVMHKTGELAAAAKKERGFSEEGAAKLKRALLAADFLGGYLTGAGAVALGLPVPLVKASMFLPSASVAYLAYSTAVNPPATWRAAKKVVAATFAKGQVAKHESEEPVFASADLAGVLADRIDRSDVDSEWWIACFCAALAEAQGDVERAVELADAAAASQPQGPGE